MKTKNCSKCKQVKPILEFPKNKSTKDGYNSRCKKCMNKYSKKYYQNNKEKLNKQIKKYRKEHKKERKKYDKNYYQSHKQRKKKYQLIHKKEKKKYSKNYRKKYKEKINTNRRERKKKDVKFKISCNIRTRIWYALKGNIKILPTMSLIGCDIEYLKYHLQCKFTKFMSWDNYGKWHIDHIRLCSSFDLSKEKEQRKCFHYTNLRPLWAENNWSRNKKTGGK